MPFCWQKVKNSVEVNVLPLSATKISGRSKNCCSFIIEPLKVEQFMVNSTISIN